MSATQYRPAVVTMNDVPRFPCLLRVVPEKWNGFDCPRFTKEVGERIIAAFFNASITDNAEYDGLSDSFEFVIEGEPWLFPVSDVIDGVNYYAIGAFGWCWEEVTRPAGIPESWPTAITSTADLLTLINALYSENRGWHFDDDPTDVVHSVNGLLLIPSFTEAEVKHLRALREDCAPLGGVWKMMEDEPTQACHKALGIMQPQTEEGQGSAGPGWAGPCPEGMDWSEHLARNNID